MKLTIIEGIGTAADDTSTKNADDACGFQQNKEELAQSSVLPMIECMHSPPLLHCFKTTSYAGVLEQHGASGNHSLPGLI
mmetsp:Transcript_54443/g.115639  ORF Transcript_54443/g.115639 Transcript_54443/m.115639 type:complete len:80 (+) Transcript_54443:165-404(+)